MWTTTFFIICLALTCGQSLHLPTEDCVIPLGSRRYWDTFWPVVFNDQGNLLDTSLVDDVESVVVPNGQSVIVSCGPNYIKKRTPKEFVDVKCLQDGKFQVENGLDLKTAKDLACDLRSIQDVLTPVSGCPSSKVSVKFGLVNPVDQKAYITGEACYCESQGKTLFAHVRKGALANSALEVVKKDIFKKPAPPSRYKVDFMKAFRLDEVNERLRDLLKIKDIPPFDMVHFVDDRFLLNRQLYSTKKLAWNYFVIHESLKNYDLLKQDIADLEGVVDIYTGSHGVATLKNNEGKRIPIYLDDNRFPIPDVIWIVVKHENKDMAFAVFNDPFLTNDEVKIKSMCKNKCNQVNWLNRLKKDQQFANVRDGYVMCCELNEFEDYIPEFPKLE